MHSERRPPIGGQLRVIFLLLAAMWPLLAPMHPYYSKAVRQGLLEIGDWVVTIAGRAPQRPAALLLTTKPDDLREVIATLEPRGVRVLLAQDAATGLERLRQPGIRMLVVDGDRPDAARLIEAGNEMPAVKVVVLHGKRNLSELAVHLIESSQQLTL